MRLKTMQIYDCMDAHQASSSWREYFDQPLSREAHLDVCFDVEAKRNVACVESELIA